MKCPNCSNEVEPSADQIAAMVAVGVTFPVMASWSLAAFIVAPYLMPLFLGGLAWSALRKTACPHCGHRFTFFQEGKR